MKLYLLIWMSAMQRRLSVIILMMGLKGRNMGKRSTMRENAVVMMMTNLAVDMTDMQAVAPEDVTTDEMKIGEVVEPAQVVNIATLRVATEAVVVVVVATGKAVTVLVLTTTIVEVEVVAVAVDIANNHHLVDQTSLNQAVDGNKAVMAGLHMAVVQDMVVRITVVVVITVHTAQILVISGIIVDVEETGVKGITNHQTSLNQQLVVATRIIPVAEITVVVTVIKPKKAVI